MEQKIRFSAILRAFRDYIQSQDYFDIVYSEKIGYLRILIHSPEEGAVLLETPEMMLEVLYGDIISDVVYGRENSSETHDDLLLTEYEKAESRRRLTAILETMESEKEYCCTLANEYMLKYQGLLTQ